MMYSIDISGSQEAVAPIVGLLIRIAVIAWVAHSYFRLYKITLKAVMYERWFLSFISGGNWRRRVQIVKALTFTFALPIGLIWLATDVKRSSWWFRTRCTIRRKWRKLWTHRT